MKVELLHHTPLTVCSNAIRTCWQSFDKSDTKTSKLVIDDAEAEHLVMHHWEDIPIDEQVCGEKDKELIYKVGNKFKHSSTLEHIIYNFYIKGISRACLQELARHRMASLSVKSTRYTLKELKEINSPLIKEVKEEDYYKASDTGVDTAVLFNKFYILEKCILDKFLVIDHNDAETNICSALALENIRLLIHAGKSNDIVKYCLPESYKTELTWTINARSLQNFLSLRTNKSALWEIRNLANAVYVALPEEHKYLFKDCISEKI